MARLTWWGGRSVWAALLIASGFQRVALGADEDPLLEDDLEDIPIWNVSANLRAGAGYDSNVTLSDLNRESSFFTGTELDLFAYRAPLMDPWEVAWLVAGEDQRFWESESVEKEQMFLTSLDVKRDLSERWIVGFNTGYLYNDQVFDASVAEGVPLRIQSKFQKLSLGPTAKLNLGNRRRLEFRALGIRNLFEAPLFDSWQTDARVLFGQGFGKRSDFTLSVETRYRPYDDRLHPTIPNGNTVTYVQHEVETALKHTWDDAQRWRSRLRAALEYNDDNGSGFFNYRKYRFAHGLTFAFGQFEAILDGKFLHYDYSREIFGGGKELSRQEVVASLRISQSLTKRLKVFAEVEHEWSLSTDRLERFDATTVWGGIDWQIR